ncbi:hypothetical protein IW492_05825 [Enterococcus sp. BWB1-3]|uniref:hypothetical protein n=1 Tax=Enterococcus sp. BWB1-3 TaxID=2787713 RepID=UPI0019203C3E|nr:hypothetical protein [Enterococcus sp. BWB1-3]MBL1228750.1 hypothetical protein [Enterococcus sp. BWB1-3]
MSDQLKELEEQLLIGQFERQFGFSPFVENTKILTDEAKEILGKHKIEYINDRCEPLQVEGVTGFVRSFDGVVFKEVQKSD